MEAKTSSFFRFLRLIIHCWMPLPPFRSFRNLFSRPFLYEPSRGRFSSLCFKKRRVHSTAQAANAWIFFAPLFTKAYDSEDFLRSGLLYSILSPSIQNYVSFIPVIFYKNSPPHPSHFSLKCLLFLFATQLLLTTVECFAFLQLRASAGANIKAHFLLLA